jgi:hypothetical protein
VAVQSYALEEGKYDFVIKRADGSLVFTLAHEDRAFAEKILANLLDGERDRAAA